MTTSTKAVCIGLGLSIVIAACLFGTYSHLFVVGASSARSAPAHHNRVPHKFPHRVCTHGKWTVTKVFTGPGVGTVVAPINITSSPGSGSLSLYSGGYNYDTTDVQVTGIPAADFPLTLNWTDWSGTHSELINMSAVAVPPLTITVTNTIPAQPTWMQPN